MMPHEDKMLPPEKYSAQLCRGIREGFAIAKDEFGTSILTPAILLYTIVAGTKWRGVNAIKWLHELGVNLDVLGEQIKNSIPVEETMQEGEEDLNKDMEQVMKRAMFFSKEMKTQYVEVEHFILALLRDKHELSYFFAEFDVSVSKYLHKIQDNKDKTEPDSEIARAMEEEELSPKALLTFGRSLKQEAVAGKLDPVIGREKEIAQVIRTLSRRRKNSPLLLGDAGVGKTAIVEGLQLEILKGRVPYHLLDKEVFEINMNDLVSGTKWRGQFEERVKAILTEATKDKRIILFIDEAHMMLGAGSAEGTGDFANSIKPKLARGEIQIIGATTWAEYVKHIEKDAALERRFNPVMVDEPNQEALREIVVNAAKYYQEFHGIRFNTDALEAIPGLTVYIPNRQNPDKAVDIMDTALANKKCVLSKVNKGYADLKQKILNGNKDAIKQLEAARASAEVEVKENLSTAAITRKDIFETVAQMAKIPIQFLMAQESKDYVHRFEVFMHEHLINQEPTIEALRKRMILSQGGITSPTRPRGIILLDGPEGVGKTYAGYLLSEFLFGSKDRVYLVDMAGMKDKIHTTSIKGAPPGYVGYDDSNKTVCDHIRRNHLSVVILDEIDEAAEDILDIWLRAFESGYIDDSHSRKVPLGNTFFIMTSNITSKLMRRQNKATLGFGNQDQTDEALRKEALEKVRNRFKRKFIDRIDEIIIVNNLVKEDLMRIARMNLDTAMINVFKKGYQVSWQDADKILEAIVEEATAGEKHHGARNIARVVENKVLLPVGQAILENPSIKKIINVGIEDSKVVVSRE